MPILNQEQVNYIKNKIAEDRPKAEEDRKKNQRLDISFKVIIFLLGVAIVITSGLSVLDIYSKALSAASAMLGTILTAGSGILSQFNFVQRQATYTTKVSALNSLQDEIVLDPDWLTVKTRLDEIQRWNDFTPPGPLTPSKPASNGREPLPETRTPSRPASDVAKPSAVLTPPNTAS